MQILSILSTQNYYVCNSNPFLIIFLYWLRIVYQIECNTNLNLKTQKLTKYMN